MNMFNVPEVVLKQSVYEKLIRDSERLKVLKEYIEDTPVYMQIDTRKLKILLGCNKNETVQGESCDKKSESSDSLTPIFIKKKLCIPESKQDGLRTFITEIDELHTVKDDTSLNTVTKAEAVENYNAGDFKNGG